MQLPILHTATALLSAGYATLALACEPSTDIVSDVSAFTATSGFALAAMDVNDDQLMDLVLLTGSAILWIRQALPGLFPSGILELAAIDAKGASVLVAQLNGDGDGRADLAVLSLTYAAISLPSRATFGLALLDNVRLRTPFTVASLLSSTSISPTNVLFFAVGDVSGDGRVADLVAGGEDLSVLFGPFTPDKLASDVVYSVPFGIVCRFSSLISMA